MAVPAEAVGARARVRAWVGQTQGFLPLDAPSCGQATGLPVLPHLNATQHPDHTLKHQRMLAAARMCADSHTHALRSLAEFIAAAKGLHCNLVR